ncbi:MAG: hydrogenase nickel incorporation protein HypB [Candidatus Diapherotrites archaeon]|nr:hydrogenase nickel incorporation protein HypB [Candidatus Diapherotrites archaeon]
MLFHLAADVGVDLFSRNRELALENRALLDAHSVRGVEFMGGIGSGKTALIEALSKDRRCAAICGDVSGDDDAKRLRKAGVEAVSVNTGKECHLDAHLVGHALESLDLEGVGVLFVENVGNLVCPADFELGCHKRAVVVSVTEGDDMIRKHPVLFGLSDVAVVNKVDLAGVMGVDVSVLEKDYASLKSSALIRTSARTGEGLQALSGALGL